MHQQARRQDVNPRRDVEVGDQAVADVVDLARPEVDHRPDPLGRQRRLAQPVHLAMDLAAQRRRDVGRRPRPSTVRRQIETISDQHDADRARAPAGSPARPGCSAASARRWSVQISDPRAGAMDRIAAQQVVRRSAGRSPCRRTAGIAWSSPVVRLTHPLPAAGRLRLAGNRASPREAIRATNSATTPSSATIKQRLDEPQDPGDHVIAAGAQELTCATIRVGLHA